MEDYELGLAKTDGGNERPSPEQVTAVKEVLDTIRKDLTDHVFSTREEMNDVRFCRWPGQSKDGRKRDDALNEAAKPFDGASDTRPFTTDSIINFIVAELSTAAAKATPRDTGMESTDARSGGFNSTLIKWLITNQWHDYRRQVELAVQYAYGDSPGAAVFWVDWCEDMEVALQLLTVEDISSMIGAILPEDSSEEEQLNIVDMLTNPERGDDLKDILSNFFPNLRPGRISKMVAQIYKEGEAEFPMPRIKSAMPKMRALRLFKDVFFPRHIEDIQRSPLVALASYYTKSEVREEAAKYGWKKTFVDDLLESGGGRSAFNETALSSAIEAIPTDAKPTNDLYEVLTVFTRAVNEDGIPGVYWQTLSYFVEEPATGRNLFDRKHGGYPCVYFSREALTSCLVDSRGVPEVTNTDQSSIKLLDDSFEDHTQVATNPVRKIPKGYPAGTFRWAPMAEIEIGPRESTSIGYVEPPDYPTANKDHYQRMRRKLSEYWGIPFEEVNERFLVMYSQQRVDGLLNALRQVFTISLQLIDQYMDIERIARITGQSPESIDATRSEREEIQGKYDISLTFDVRDLDMEFLVKKVEVALKFRQIDADNLIDYSKIAVNAVAALDPNWAQDAVRTPEAASAIEAKGAREDLIKMLNGVRPERPQDNHAQNFPARLQILQQEMELRMNNPQAFPPVTPAAAALIQEQMEYLGHQSQQRTNAITGRTGVQETDLSQVGMEQMPPAGPEMQPEVM